MAYTESHQSLGSHPKTHRLARLLGISRPQAVGHLHYFWWWALDYAPDGDLGRYEAADVATGAAWEGSAEAFWEALVEAGFVDCDEEGSRIHDWDDYGGKLVQRRRANAERMRAARGASDPPVSARADTDAEGVSARALHVQRTCSHVQSQRREEKSRGDQRRGESLSDGEGCGEGCAADAAPQTPPPPPSGSRPPKRTRVPADFVVTAAMRDLAVSYGVPPEAVDGETQKFLDHFAASGELKADWVAAWRNWMRRAPEFAPRRSGSGPARASPNGTGLSRSRPGMTAEETAAFARELERAGL